MYCTNCGKKLEDDLAFCTECGCKMGTTPTLNSSATNSSDRIASYNKKSLWGYFVGVIKEFYNFMVTGRSRRTEYWGFTLFQFIFCIIAAMIDLFLFGGEKMIIFEYVSSILLFPQWRLSFRRMHDVGKPAGYIFIPFYSFILSLKDSEPNTNKYGPNPKN